MTHDRQQLPVADFEGLPPGPMGSGSVYSTVFKLRKKFDEVGEKCGAQRRDGGGFRDPGLRPAVNESEKGTVGGVQIDIFAAGAGQHRRKLGVGEGAEQA